MLAIWNRKTENSATRWIPILSTPSLQPSVKVEARQRLLPIAPFPLPYADNFEDTADCTRARASSPTRTAPSKRILVCSAKDSCLEQVITVKPIPWGPLPDPFTLAGDVKWSDYRIAVDFLLARRRARHVDGSHR